MDAELLVAGESLEMSTGPPKTLDMGELGEVVVIIAEPNSVTYPLLSLLLGLRDWTQSTGKNARNWQMVRIAMKTQLLFCATKASQDPIYGAYSDSVGFAGPWKSLVL